MKRIKQASFSLTFVLFLISCNNHPDSNTARDKAPSIDSPGIKVTDGAQTRAVDKALIKKYEEAFRNDTIPSEKIFFSKLLNIIKQFEGRKLDTTVLAVGNLDGDDVKDTIFSRVYYMPDSIIVDSKWIKNNNVLWNYKYTDPYLGFNSDLLVPTERSTWAIFAVGVLYGGPDFSSRKEFDDRVDSSVQKIVYDDGVFDLKEMGITVSKEDYRAYLQNFKGDVLALGEPETRERLWIWYKPAKRLITYYQP